MANCSEPARHRTAADSFRIARGCDAGLPDRSGRRRRCTARPKCRRNIAIKLPLPPNLQTIWGDDDRFVSGYCRSSTGTTPPVMAALLMTTGTSMSWGEQTTINVAGHRLSTGSMEAVVAEHPDVAECAVIGVHDALKGQVSPRADRSASRCAGPPDQIAAAVVASVREHIGPVAALKSVVCVPALPKTRSGKILRRSMWAIAEGREEPVPSTIEDPKVLETITPYLLGD